ncbi:Brain tumor protein-like [Oopsacas minuta]|uniref:Brain tumor protein-like n=1 Tax=Oopsacas minuta TaxID=111878 RepID=A0AAV7JTB7_9METZ|nr:Brain tumor protein-like [Oopsacas minuta]
MIHNSSKHDPLSSEEQYLWLSKNANKKSRMEDQRNQIRNGKTVTEFIFGEESTSFTKLVDPYHFSINPTEDIILFCNTNDNLLQLYTLGGDFITTFTNQLLNSLIDVLFIKDAIYVTEDYSLEYFTDFADKSVRFNTWIDQMWSPLGLTCDSRENIYFIDEFGHHIIVFEKDLNSFQEIDVIPYTNCLVDIFVEYDELFLLSQSPRHIIKLSLEGEFIFRINCSNFLSFPITFCPDGNGDILISDSRSNNVLFVISTGNLQISLITLDRILPKSEKFRNVAVVRNSSLIVSSLEYCYSLVLT